MLVSSLTNRLHEAVIPEKLTVNQLQVIPPCGALWDTMHVHYTRHLHVLVTSPYSALKNAAKRPCTTFCNIVFYMVWGSMPPYPQAGIPPLVGH